MQWIEPTVFSKERARLRNRLLFQGIAFQGVLWGLFFAVCITVRLYVAYQRVDWEAFSVVFAGLSAFVTLVLSMRNWKNWSRPSERRIILADRTLAVSEDGFVSTRNYTDFLGFTIFDKDEGVPAPGLLVFGNKAGHHVGIGIASKSAVQDIRSFLTGKLKEMQNDELPKRSAG